MRRDGTRLTKTAGQGEDESANAESEWGSAQEQLLDSAHLRTCRGDTRDVHMGPKWALARVGQRAQRAMRCSPSPNQTLTRVGSVINTEGRKRWRWIFRWTLITQANLRGTRGLETTRSDAAIDTPLRQLAHKNQLFGCSLYQVLRCAKKCSTLAWHTAGCAAASAQQAGLTWLMCLLLSWSQSSALAQLVYSPQSSSVPSPLLSTPR